MAKKSVLSITKPLDQIRLGDGIFMTEQSKTTLLFTDLENGNLIILEGEGFKVKAGKVTAGTVEDMFIMNAQGKLVLEFTGMDVLAKPLPQELPTAFVNALLESGLSKSNIINGSKLSDELQGYAGKDIIKGNRGDDILDGMTGRDQLFGGAGEDFFRFAEGYGKDSIMDFDADGSDGRQDLIIADYAAVLSEKTVKGNTVLDFGDGDVLTIMGVRAKDIDATDFVT